MNARQQQIYIGEQIRAMREAAGMTQEDIAAETDSSRATVIRTEAGDSQIIRYLIAWKRYCQITRQDPVRATLRVLFPEQFAKADEDADRTAKIKRLDMYLHEAAPDLIVEQLDNIFYGAHGSDPEALLQAFTAYLHCPLFMRHTITQNVATSYQQAEYRGLDPIQDAVHPDMQILERALSAGFEASLSGRDSYSLSSGRDAK